MTKKIFAILIAATVCLSMALSASAYTSQYVYDPEYNLSDSELYELNNYAAGIENESGYALIFCIISDNGGMSNAEFAEEAYYSYTDSENAVVFVHNETEKVYNYYIAGDENGAFSDAVIDAMKTAYDTNESYYGGIMGFYAAAETALDTPVYETAPIGGNAVTNAPGSYVTEFEKVERTLPLVVDQANIIPDDVETALIARCEKIAEEYEMEVAIHTTYDFGGLIAEAYADDYYDFNGYGYGENDDGMLVVYKPGEEGEREIYITTHGNGSSVFFEGIRDGIIADMKDYLIAEDYEKAFNIYLDRAEEQLKPGTPVIWLFVLALVGAVVGLLITGSMTSKNKSVVAQNHAKVYTRQGSMVVTGAQDVYAYSFVDTKPKQTNSSSNDSSTHTSSSGRTHNGSGAKF
ncbi:MAG: TPM domain-containing protein [Clostridia bacterium]|nr:TPM domain-containing protein [Clostridia bacterium]